MCERCEEKARGHVEDAIKLLGHDLNLIAPVLREDLEKSTYDDADVDNFFIQAAISRLAMAISMRTKEAPFIVMGGIAGTMMMCQMETEVQHDFMNMTGQNPN